MPGALKVLIFAWGPMPGELKVSIFAWGPMPGKLKVLGSSKKPLGAPDQKTASFSTKTSKGELQKSPCALQARKWPVLVLELILGS